MKHGLSVLVENKPGVLSRVTGLISRRGFNIESLSVGPTEDPTMSRVTAIVKADDVAYEQITKQLHKLISVHKITDLTDEGAIERELALYKVNAASERRSEIIEIANIFRAKIVDVGRGSLTIEATGDEEKLKGLEDLLRADGSKEIVRTDVYKRQDVENRMPERRRGSRGRPEARGGSVPLDPARSVTRKGTPRYVIGSSFLCGAQRLRRAAGGRRRRVRCSDEITQGAMTECMRCVQARRLERPNVSRNRAFGRKTET